MRSGKFNHQIYSKIDECEDFVLVLSENALDRCSNTEDWVRLEIEYALHKKKNIILVLGRDFTFPTDLPESIKEIRFYQGVTANSEFFDSVIKKLEDMFASKPQPERTEQKAEEDVSEFMDILTNLYEATVSYRNAFRSGVQDDINTASSNMANLLQKLYYICEKGKYANGKKRMIQKCTEIIDQFNRYVPCYSAFSNCTNKISIEAQEYARCAENEFKKFVEKICAVLGD